VLGGLGTSTPGGTSATRAAAAGISIVAPCWLHSFLSTVTVIVPRSAPWPAATKSPVWWSVWPAPHPGPGRQTASSLAGDCQAPLRKSNTTGLSPPGLSFPCSSNMAPVARQGLGRARSSKSPPGADVWWLRVGRGVVGLLFAIDIDAVRPVQRFSRAREVMTVRRCGFGRRASDAPSRARRHEWSRCRSRGR